jgi:hypothetical protein
MQTKEKFADPVKGLCYRARIPPPEIGHARNQQGCQGSSKGCSYPGRQVTN